MVPSGAGSVYFLLEHGCGQRVLGVAIMLGRPSEAPPILPEARAVSGCPGSGQCPTGCCCPALTRNHESLTGQFPMNPRRVSQERQLLKR